MKGPGLSTSLGLPRLTDIRDQERLSARMFIMESIGKKKSRPRRSFPAEFKAVWKSSQTASSTAGSWSHAM